MVQLYDLESDPEEKKNLQAEHPEIVKEMSKVLHTIQKAGRSTPLPVQP
jgi:arylsulfatase A